ncbi:MAG: hypothetical protein AB7N24_23580 [Dehalococcoidia bacterium]
MTTRTCPRCKLISPQEALVCDCGHEFASGKLRLTPVASALSSAERAQVVEAADRYRVMVTFATIQLIAGVSSRVLGRISRGQDDSGAQLAIALVSFVTLIVASAAASRAAYGAAEGIGLRNPGAWAAGVFFAGVFAVIALNSRAKEWCQRYGLRLGLLGPVRADIERLARGDS